MLHWMERNCLAVKDECRIPVCGHFIMYAYCSLDPIKSECTLFHNLILGHALEAGWFLLQYAQAKGDAQLQKIAVDKFIEVPFHTGWDKQHGGLFYFLDVDGHCPTQVRLNYNIKTCTDISVEVNAFVDDRTNTSFIAGKNRKCL